MTPPAHILVVPRTIMFSIGSNSGKYDPLGSRLSLRNRSLLGLHNHWKKLRHIVIRLSVGNICLTRLQSLRHLVPSYVLSAPPWKIWLSRLSFQERLALFYIPSAVPRKNITDTAFVTLLQLTLFWSVVYRKVFECFVRQPSQCICRYIAQLIEFSFIINVRQSELRFCDTPDVVQFVLEHGVSRLYSFWKTKSDHAKSRSAVYHSIHYSCRSFHFQEQCI